MTPPRQILPGQTILLTVQATGRSFRFLPTPRVAATILFIFFATLIGFKIDVHEYCFLSNHFHVVMTPHERNLPAFTQKFHSTLSRALNALRGFRGANIEKQYSIVVETDPEAILRHCAYTLANPVAADLVSQIRHWKGPHSFGLEYGEEVVVDRPKCGLWKPLAQKRKRKRKRAWDKTRRSFRGRWAMPEQVAFKLVRPPVGLGRMSDRQVRAEVRKRALEAQTRAEQRRRKAGRKALGMRRVLAQNCLAVPNKPQELFGPVPKVASSNRWSKQAALQVSKAFVAAYRDALHKWKSGQRDVVFPDGTYQMRTRFDVNCGCAPPG